MPPVRITTADDPRIRLFTGVREPELLRAHRLLIGEGRLVIERLIESGRYPVRALLLNDASHDALAPWLERLTPDVDIFLLDTPQFAALTGFNLHRGCLALAERPRPQTMVRAIGDARLIVVLEAVSDADNVGSVFRNVAAFGAGAVLLSPTCCDPLYRKSIRTSMGASLIVPFARLMHWERDMDALRDAGFARVALTPDAGGERLSEFCAEPRPARLAIFVGTEGAGLSATTLARVDRRLRIPMTGAVDSVNLAVATGIVLSRLLD